MVRDLRRNGRRALSARGSLRPACGFDRTGLKQDQRVKGMQKHVRSCRSRCETDADSRYARVRVQWLRPTESPRPTMSKL
jgi:hypothetical protein